MTFNSYLSLSKTINKLTDLKIEDLHHFGWKGLVLDFDGVLASLYKIEPDHPMIIWANEMSEHGIYVAIHSNNSLQLSQKRQSWLRKSYPNISWMPPKPYKPNPSTLLHLRQRWKLEPEELVMIDDRFSTGGKAAYRAECQFIYIKKPLIDNSFAPLGELWFHLVRFLERAQYQEPPVLCTREDSNL